MCVCVCIFTRCADQSATTTSIASVCPKCGLIKKSGRLSCCARGGSWFGKCGSVGDTNLHHTWDDGFQACKVQLQSKTVMSEQLRAPRQQANDSSNGADNSNSIKLIASSAPSIIARAHVPVNTSTAYTTPTMDAKPIAAALTAIMSAPYNASTTLSSTAISNQSVTNSSGSPMGHNFTKTSMTAPVYRSVISQGCTQMSGITVCMRLMCTVALFSICLCI